jgi:exodeoxyribonuclease-5
MVQLTDEQSRAVQAVQDWFQGNPAEAPYYLAGPAGTGKTTIAKSIAMALGSHGFPVDAVFGAYTGKAAHVLRRKGVPATTIHSAIYYPVDNYEARAELREVERQWAMTDPEETSRQDELQDRINQLQAAIRRPGFELNLMSEWAYADLIVLDEVSMVNEKMAADILSFGVPVLVLGDPAQLPPVAGEGYFTKRAPDFELTEIHRQALESPVLKLATDIRLGKGWPVEKVSLDKAMTADQVIVWKNATRWNLIERIRAKLGRPKGVPVPGDKIQCLANNRDLGLLNGQQFEVVNTFDGAQRLSLRDDDGVIREIECYLEAFTGLEGEKHVKDSKATWRGKVAFLTFAQVVTCHKAQGSEWDSIYVVDQTHQMWRADEQEKRRWAYTAVSRASESVTIASTRA